METSPLRKDELLIDNSSSGSIVSDYGLGDRGSILGGVKGFFL
jgi:hypothetical protein